MAKNNKKLVSLTSLKDITKEIPSKVTIDFHGQVLEVVQYLETVPKRALVEIVVGNSVREDGVVDYHMVDIMKCYMITHYYSNINLNDKIYDMYDLLIQSGVYEVILNNIPIDELEYIDELIELMIEQEVAKIERNNTLAGVVKRFIDSINVQEMLDAVNGFDANKLSALIPEGDKQKIFPIKK